MLGEAVIGVINGISELSEAGDLSGSTLLTAPLGLAVGFGLWWVYFDFVARRRPRPTFATALGWVYLHVVVTACITVAGAGISLAITEDASGGLRNPSQHLLASGVGLALLVVAVLETTLDRSDDEPTHQVVSPALKAATGAAVLVLGWAPVEWSTPALFVVLVAALAVPAVYGVRVWYGRGPGAVFRG